MKYLILFIPIIFLLQENYAQEVNRDSLGRVYKEGAAWDAADAAYQLARSYAYEDLSLGIKYAKDAIRLSPDTISKDTHAKLYLLLGGLLRRQGSFQEALDTLFVSLEYITELKNKLVASRILNIIGLVHQNLGHDTLSIESYIKSLKLSEIIDDKRNLISVTLNMGNFYSMNNNKDKALAYYNRALLMAEELNSPMQIAQIKNNIGTIYHFLQNYDKAKKYYKETEVILRQVKDKDDLAIVLANLGFVYWYTDEKERGKKCLEEAYGLYQETGLDKVDPLIYSHMATVYSGEGKVEKAKYFYNKYIDFTHAKGWYVKEGGAKLNLGSLYETVKDFPMALDLYKEALIIAKQTNDFELLTENYLALSQMYEHMKDVERGLKFLKLHLAYKDSLNKAKAEQIVLEMDGKYQLEMKEQRIATLQKDAEIQQLLVEKQKHNNALLIIILIGSVLILVLIAFLLYVRTRNNKKLKERNQLIRLQNDKLNEMNQSLTESERDLILSNQTKETFLAIVAHDLKNPLISLKNLFFVLGANPEAFSRDQMVEQFKAIETSIKSSVDFLNDLLKWAMSQLDEIKVKYEDFILQELLNEVLAVVNTTALTKEIDFRIDSEKEIELSSDKDMFRFILKNLLGNAVKFALPNTSVNIKLSETNNVLRVEIQDEGIGISEEKLETIFDKDVDKSTSGIMVEKGTGLGLYMCADFIKKLEGKIYAQSEEGKGSVFAFEIPINELENKAS
jgi:signal transduction histidine kinase/Tfp pilus assembly protein PilF